MAVLDPKSSLPHVVIIGGGFGGLQAARQLAGRPVRVTLIDKRNFHLFQPLLYQVATGTLPGTDIAASLRMTLAHADNIDVLLGEVTDLDPATRQIILKDGQRLSYDTLVVAAGSRTNYFGNQTLAEAIPGLKTLEDAIDIRRRILTAFEQAEQERDRDRQRALLTFVITGGGPTGVELAGSISELAHRILKHQYHHIRWEDITILLVEGLDTVLGPYPPDMQRKALERLTQLGVTFVPNTLLTHCEGQQVTLKEKDRERTITAQTVIWTAGIAPVALAKTLADKTGVTPTKRAALPVEADFSLPGYPEIFVIGDLCHYEHAGMPPLPGIAPAAMQAGQYVGKVLLARQRGQSPAPFRYQDKGTLAVIGQGRAVAAIGKVRLDGLLAWLLWAGVHIFYLIGFENRLSVMANWLWTAMFRYHGALVIAAAPADGRPAPKPAQIEMSSG